MARCAPALDPAADRAAFSRSLSPCRINAQVRENAQTPRGARSTVSREKHPAFRQTPLKRLIAKAATENMRPTIHSNSDGVI